MEYIPCIGNSSYSFWWILLKLYRCFKDGLEICILFFQNPEIIFYHFFRIFNLDIFRALILQIWIWSIYLVSATPPTVFGESFWNFTVVFRMVWRYAYCFLRILKLFFLHFNLDIFSSLYATDMYREYMPCIGNPAYSFRPILLKLYRYFAAFLWFHMRNLSLAGYNCSGGASCMACSFINYMRNKLCKNEPRHDETNKMSVRPAKTQISLGIRPVWSESSLCAEWVAKDPSFLHADSEDSDQTGRMPRLIWVYAERTLTLLVLSCRGSNEWHREETCIDTDGQSIAPYQLIRKRFIRKLIVHHIQWEIILNLKAFSAPEKKPIKCLRIFVR